VSNGTVAAAAVYSLVACIVAVTLLTSLSSRQRRRLTAIEAKLKQLSDDFRRLEIAHESLLVRFLNLPRPLREEPQKSSSPAIKLEAEIAPIQPDQKSSNDSAQIVSLQDHR
jgi:hypothetical protein